MATGRTVSKWFSFVLDDSGGTIRDIAVYTISVVGIVYAEQDLTALADQITGAMSNMPDAPIEITGPFSNTAAGAASGSGVAASYSGSHTVLNGVNGGVTPLTLDCQFGIQSLWSTGDPQFGVTSSSANGYLCTAYTLDAATMIYSARLVLFPGSAAPAWGTAAET